ncbi:hypothetical protein LXL04_016959 [Taraxacum kok-saghyz]
MPLIRGKEALGWGSIGKRSTKVPMTPSSTGKRHRVYRPLSVEGQGFDPYWKHLWGIFSRLAT